VPCTRLSWPFRQLLSARKYTVSYRSHVLLAVLENNRSCRTLLSHAVGTSDDDDDDIAGEAYRYTLTPVLSNLSTGFRCLVGRRVPDVIYRLAIYVTLPGPDAVESPTVQQQVRGHRDLVQRGRHTLFDMLTVEHDVGGPSTDSELVLTARRPATTTHVATDIDNETFNYTVQPASIGRTTANKHVLYTPGGASALIVITNRFVECHYQLIDQQISTNGSSSKLPMRSMICSM